MVDTEIRTLNSPSLGPAAWILHGMVRMYQWVMAGRISPCRHIPSCSNYALEAFEVHGFWRGAWLSITRLGRCHPWGTHGWDPVPGRKAT